MSRIARALRVALTVAFASLAVALAKLASAAFAIAEWVEVRPATDPCCDEYDARDEHGSCRDYRPRAKPLPRRYELRHAGRRYSLDEAEFEALRPALDKLTSPGGRS